jgi:hypothetical protein
MTFVTGAATGFAAGGPALVKVLLTDQTNITSLNTQPTDSHAGYQLNSDGNAEKGTGTTSVSYGAISGQWLLSGLNSAYEVQVTVNSGALTTGTTGSWMALSTTRNWTCVDTTDGTSTTTANLTVEIRDAVSLDVLTSANIVLKAQILP